MAESSLALDAAGSGEAAALAYTMAQEYRRTVEAYQRLYNLKEAEANARAAGDLEGMTSANTERALSAPVREVSWHDLSTLVKHDQEAAYRRWQEIKNEAQLDLTSGQWAYTAIEPYTAGPWDRAQFVAIRQSLIDAWQPANGIELALIDQMAQAQTLMFHWQKQMSMSLAADTINRERPVNKGQVWQPPQVSSYDGAEQAAAMIDRFNRLFLRTLRHLRDLRRYAPAVTIQTAGQVNIGGAQVNVTSGPSKAQAKPAPQIVEVSGREQ
jgi:hypothetical protein